MRTCGRKCGASARWAGRWAGRKRPQRHRVLAQAVLQQAPPSKAHVDQHVRQGDTEAPYVAAQAAKPESDQKDIASYLTLRPRDATDAVDVCIVGCGPAGLALAAEVASRGRSVCLVGPESKFTNNYGVWLDEFKALGLEHLLDHVWGESICFFKDREKRLSRAYGRVDRAALRHHLLSRCAAHGVAYVPALATALDHPADAPLATVRSDGRDVVARIVTLAGGAVSAKFLNFEDHAPAVAAQTAYGVTAVVEGYEDAYDPDTMLFMDYRRTHSGMWDGTGAVLSRNMRDGEVNHPNWDGTQGSCNEAPSFLYAMPLSSGEVFLEETCLVARPTLPFSTLKRRLHRRCASMGIRIKEIRDEEYSFIPVGGPMPEGSQSVTAFGAAANLVHPATGYSIARMLEESAPLGAAMDAILAREGSVGESAGAVWEALWPMEKRRQASFHIFGMELLASLDVQRLHDFFETFFALPDRYWRGFLASKLNSGELMVFALLTFVTCSWGTRLRLMQHLFTDSSGSYLVRTYTKELRDAAGAKVRQLSKR